MLIVEYRVTLPLTVEEYQVAQLFSVIEASRNETGGGDGVEILVNEPYTNHPLLGDQFSEGQYTRKKYHLSNKVGPVVRALLPKSALVLEETAWNAYPYCRTVLTNEYMKHDFHITIESFHLPDRGNQENVHKLPPEKLAEREIVHIDIAEELMSSGDYKPHEDPSKFVSMKTNRGPLKDGWMQSCTPVMTCYKLVTCEFRWFGLQTRIEQMIMKHEKRLFTNFHRQVFCSIDRWFGLTMQDIRRMEDEVRHQLEAQRATGAIRGSTATD